MSQLVKAGPNTASYPNPNDLDGIKAWMIGSAAAAALVATQNAYQNYLHGPFTTWNMNFQAGRAEEPPPAIPSGFDGQMSDDGLDYTLVASGSPSGPPPTYPKPVVIPPSPIIRPAAQSSGLLIAQIGVPFTQKDGTVFVRLS